jgi:hypothetical protein
MIPAKGAQKHPPVTKSTTFQKAFLARLLDGLADLMVKREEEEGLKALDRRIQTATNASQLLDRAEA